MNIGYPGQVVFKFSLSLLFPLLVLSFCSPAEAKPCGQSDIRCAQLAQWAQDYPFVKDRRSSDYLFVAGGIYQFERFDPNLGRATVIVPGDKKAISVHQLLKLLEENNDLGKTRTPVIAYGSNAAPWVLADKFTRLYGDNKEYLGSMTIPVTKAKLKNFDVTWLPRFAGYGVLPATISAASGTEVEVWLTWLTDDQLTLMNKSEEIGKKGGMYSLNIMPKRQVVTNSYQLGEDPVIYISCYGALRAPNGDAVAIAQIPASNRKLEEMNTIQTLTYVASLLGFQGTGFEFLADNVRSLHQDAILTGRNDIIRSYSVRSPRLQLVSPEYECKGIRSTN